MTSEYKHKHKIPLCHLGCCCKKRLPAALLMVFIVLGLIGCTQTVSSKNTLTINGAAYQMCDSKEMSAFDFYDVSYLSKTDTFQDDMDNRAYSASDPDTVYSDVYSRYAKIYADPSLSVPISGKMFTTDYKEDTIALVPIEDPYADFGQTNNAKKLEKAGFNLSPFMNCFSLLGTAEQDAFKGTLYHDGEDYELGSQRSYYDEAENNGWLHYNKYWVVEYYGDNGKKLDNPRLTEVDIKDRELATPQNLHTSIDDSGWLNLTWDPVEGAQKYAILLYNPAHDTNGNDKNIRPAVLLDVVDDSSAASWSSGHAQNYLAYGNSSDFLAVNITADDLQSEDFYAIQKNRDMLYQAGDVFVAVVAMNDGYMSVPAAAQIVGPGAEVDGAAMPVGTRPLSANQETGWSEQLDSNIYILPEERDRMMADFQSYPVVAPYLSADGSLHQSSTQIAVDAAGKASDIMVYIDGSRMSSLSIDIWMSANNGWELPAARIIPAPKGTHTLASGFESYIILTDPSYDYMADIEAYNKWSCQQTPQTDMTLLRVDDSTLKARFESNKLRRTEESKKPASPLNEITDQLSDDPILQYIMAQYNVGNEAFPVDQYQQAGETDMMFKARITRLAAIAWNENGFAYCNVAYPLYQDGYIMALYSTDATPEQVGETAQAALDGMDLSGGDADKVRQINEYVTSHLEYDYDQKSFDLHDPSSQVTFEKMLGASHSTAGAFASGKAVCDGYAGMFQALATKAGLESRLVLGRADGQRHAWNVVKIDGTWKLVDATWNDADADAYLLVNSMADLPDTDRQMETANWIDKSDPVFTEIVNDLGAQNYLFDSVD